MFRKNLIPYKLKILRVLLPLFLFSSLNFYTEPTSQFINEQPVRETYLNTVSVFNFSGVYSNIENKPGHQVKPLFIFNPFGSGFELLFSASYDSNIKNTSIKDFRLRTFLISQFGTDT